MRSSGACNCSASSFLPSFFISAAFSSTSTSLP
jgi:hypothetical protein